MSKILVVNPDWGLQWQIYVYEYLASLDLEGNTCFYLDLSKVNRILFRRPIRIVFYKLSRRNMIEDKINELMESRGIRKIGTIRNTSMSKIFGFLNKDKTLSQDFSRSLHSYFSRITGDITFLPENISSRELRRIRKMYNFSYRQTDFIIKKYKIDLVITVNGRHLVDSAVRIAAEENSKECNFLEGGTLSNQNWRLYKSSPHDYRELVEMANREWEESACDEAQAIEGVKVRFKGQTIGDGRSWNSFYSSEYTDTWFVREIGEQPFITFYANSRLEIPSSSHIPLPDSFNGSQKESLLRLNEELNGLNYRLVCRAHPPAYLNVGHEKVEDEYWQEFCKVNGIIYVASNSKVDSRKLILESSLNVVYVSWMALESIILRKPTLVLGNNCDLSLVFPEISATNQEEIREFLKKDFPIIDPKKSYPLFRTLAHGGKPFQNIIINQRQVPVDLNGKELNEIRPFVQKIKNHLFK